MSLQLQLLQSLEFRLWALEGVRVSKLHQNDSAHPWVIRNTPAKSEVNLMYGSCAM